MDDLIFGLATKKNTFSFSFNIFRNQRNQVKRGKKEKNAIGTPSEEKHSRAPHEGLRAGPQQQFGEG